MSETDERWFEVTINWSPSSRVDLKWEIGPYEDKQIDDHGYPPLNDITNALWSMVGDFVAVKEKNTD